MYRKMLTYEEGRPRLDLDYPIYGVHELTSNEAFTSVIVLAASFSIWVWSSRDLNPQTSLLGMRLQPMSVFLLLDISHE